jgi:hypothetical protein
MPQKQDYGKTKVVRTILSVDIETGIGVAVGEVPEGSVISVGELKPGDIQAGARASASDIAGKIRGNMADGYNYSMFFIVSCAGRYFAMAHRKNLEASAMIEGLPRGIPITGFYGFGEICPRSVKDGRAENSALNESLVIMAI